MGYKIEDLNQNELFKTLNMPYYLDSLTGVLNRDTLIAFVKHLIRQNVFFSLHLLDIDNFKLINDELGHQVGDKVLKEVVEVILSETKSTSIVGRYGGDEFLIVTPYCYEYNDVWNYTKTIFESVRNKNIQGVMDSNITITAGVSVYPKDADNYDTLFLKMDKALYRGKQKGRNCFIIYDDDKHKNINISTETEETSEMMEEMFDLLMSSCNLKERLSKITSYVCKLYNLSGYLMLNNETVYPLYAEEGYKLNPLNLDLLEEVLNSKTTLVINDYSKLKISIPFLHEYSWQNLIKSFAIVRLYAFDKEFGYLLLVNYHIKRIWQKKERVLFSYLSKLISLMLYYNKNEEELC